MNHLDYCTHVKFEDDRDILTRPNFNVNIRLLKTSLGYKKLIKSCVEYIIWLAQTKKKGYKLPHGWSGANAGIPFNIIALCDGQYFINPRILNKRFPKLVYTNCGSLTLPKLVSVIRFAEIDLMWWDYDGVAFIMKNPSNGYTIQHEIDHTKGVLIA